MNPVTVQRVIVLIIVVLIAIGVCVAGGDGGASVGRLSVFAICGIIAFAVNWLAFIPANMAQTERYYDLTGSATYLMVIAVAVLLVPELTLRGQLAAIMVVVWSLRLGSFLFKRINSAGQDDRFDEIKTRPLRFFIAWTLQALWVLLTAACALAIISGGNDLAIGSLGVVGLSLWLLGFICEVVADTQKNAFKRNSDNKGRFINTGLWSWSRHPNYFGEILLWVGMAVLAWPILTGWQYVTLISPIFVTLLLLKVSGVPMLAKKGLEKWGDDPDYRAYLTNTSLLIPRPPKKVTSRY